MHLAKPSLLFVAMALACGGVACGAAEPEWEGEELGTDVAPLVTATQTGKLFASDGKAADQYGSSVATDGTTLVIGALFADAPVSDGGAAYVYTRSGASWTFVQKLVPAGLLGGDSVGASVAVEGNTLVVGAHKSGILGVGKELGAVYVYQNTSGVWSQTQKLEAPDKAVYDHHGWSVDLQGGMLLVASPEDDDKGTDSGSLYVYTQNGSTFSFTQKLTASDGAAVDGFSSSFERDGNTLVVGSRYHDVPLPNCGAAYVFTYANGLWTQAAKLTAPDAAHSDNFGAEVAVSGSRVLVTAIGDDDKGTDAGSAYLFKNTSGSWAFEQKLLASDGAATDNLGRSCAIQGNVAMVGSPNDDDAGTDSGSVYVFGLSAAGWTQDQKLVASDGTPTARLGYAILIDGAEAYVSATLATGQVASSGAEYQFSVSAPFDCSALADGSPCDDGNLCTTADTCQSGVCVSGAPVTCAAPGVCQSANACDPSTGQCLATPVADGTPCSDGVACSGPDTCQSGACVSGPGADTDADGLCDGADNCPTTWNPSQLDLNLDGAGDACVTACLTYQRGTSGTVIDASVDANLAAANYGAAQALYTGLVNGTLRRTAVRADVSAIPVGSTVQSATLTLQAAWAAGGLGTIRAHDITASWTETGITWANAAFSPTVWASATAAQSAPVSFNVATLAQGWLNGTTPNHGVMLEQDAGAGTTFRSSEWATVAQRPKLVLCFLAPAQ